MPYETTRALTTEAQRACVLAWIEIRKLGADATVNDEDVLFEFWTDQVVGHGSRVSRWPAPTHDIDLSGIEDVAALRETPVWKWALTHASAAPAILAAVLVVEALRVELLAAGRTGEVLSHAPRPSGGLSA